MGAFDIQYGDNANQPLGGTGAATPAAQTKAQNIAQPAPNTQPQGEGGTQAASALNSLHASASVSGSGSNSVSYSYSNDTVSAAPTKTGV